jgi:hypothetical protein
MSCWPRQLSDRLKNRRPERHYQNARVFICEPESTKLLAAKASPGARMAVVFGRDSIILPRSAAAVLLIESLVTRPVCSGGPSPF